MVKTANKIKKRVKILWNIYIFVQNCGIINLSSETGCRVAADIHGNYIITMELKKGPAKEKIWI